MSMSQGAEPSTFRVWGRPVQGCLTGFFKLFIVVLLVLNSGGFRRVLTLTYLGFQNMAAIARHIF